MKKALHFSLYKHLLFLALTLFVVLAYGYYFGTFDQSSHIPFLKKTVNPSLFPNDHFFDLRTSHYSYFWLLFIPFYRAGVLEISMFIVHILATYLTFWALWNLSKTLFNNTLTSFLVVVSNALPHIGFSGFPLFEFSMLNRTVSLSFELIAINYYLKKNYFISFFLLGILYNFHILSVHFIIAMIGIDTLLSIRSHREKFFSILKAIPIFIVCALPVIIWKANHTGIGVILHPNREWYSILNNALFYHLFNFISFNNPIVILLTVGGISAIALFFFTQKTIKGNRHTTIKHFMYAGILILITQLIATYIFPSTIIIQSQVMRIGIFISLFAYLYLAHYVSLWGHRSRVVFIFLATSLLFSFSPLFSLVSLLLIKQITSTKRMLIGSLMCLCLFLSVLGALLFFNLARPKLSIWPEKTPFYDIQLWAKKNTPKSAVFITPPSKWWLYDVEWRVISERSTVSTLSELLEAAFDPSYVHYWKPRFEDIAPGALVQFKGDYLANFKIANNAYYTNTSERFLYLAKKYNASYLVVEKKRRYRLPILYENKEYIVYSLIVHE
ncbi:hypothetical protein COW57_00095 [Candidatus Roizmanbacteria bacterium CG17_big_fil_post_rev_8_21_14_2_50_39_7]|uniref:DUF6798 domain-containing protein n=4 Tax=Candidatus Roizmaniibacteriota TaxID=1752723 RepID=A0A2H0KJK9_9BACT|nr:MAG: hypothetical protein COV87_03575 [Candidatus Roizmanbacteria bacterium CG11_big_fil_rev_8_21_14_0_20_37_16]PIV08457.1 MAG: hypothetical protein COS52_02595 [Candidatus Roizmanbacteria bacterium CG03_land_8_20_14_0_80_39_12]PIV71335.1 MAG: hypothetical protein COW57_00095 [Candidatus Roizmanbacteria bacterium CG17_big_fil_post_rev_8_21_14_2_50_39_7]